jgi:hypothetical protein
LDVTTGLNATSSSPTFITDRYGDPKGAIYINGGSTYWEAPDASYFAGDFSVAVWAKINQFDGYRRIFDFSNGPDSDNVLIQTIVNSGNNYFQYYEGLGRTPTNLPTSCALPTGQWVHLAFTFSGLTGSYYRNGTLCGSGTVARAPANVVRTKSYIGKSAYSGDLIANAVYDDFKIFNRCLTAAQVLADYTAINNV